MRKLAYLFTVGLAAVVGALALASPASASNVPAGCASPQYINSTAIKIEVASSSWRVGTLTQYWGWCDGGYKRNWAHIHFREGTSAYDVKIAIQTRDFKLHGYRTVGNNKRDFTSRPAATMCCSTRAWMKGTVFSGGGVQTIYATKTAWT